MKKAIAILLALSMLLGLTACGGASTAPAGSADSAQSEAPAEPVPETGPEAAQGAAQEAAAEATQEAVQEAAAEATQEAVQEAAAEATQGAAQEAAAETMVSSPAGSYKLTGLTSEAGSELDIVSTVVGMGAKYYLFLEKDGTGYMNFMEAEIPLNWDDSSIVIEPQVKEETLRTVTIPCNYEEGSLQINTQAYSMEFTRLTDEEVADYQANGSGSLTGIIGKAADALVSKMDVDLVSGLLSGLSQGIPGMGDITSKPIPEGEPSEGAVTGTVDGLVFTVIGADRLQSDEGECMAFYYDVTNENDDLCPAWNNDMEAAQDGSFLTDVYLPKETLQEQYNVNLKIAPGRTLRCASVFMFDPDGGTVGFRISSRHDDSTVLYYADPQKLTGPPEPFVYDADPSIPAFLEGLPEETEKVRVENVEFFTDEDGRNNVRIFWRFLNTTGVDGVTFTDAHTCCTIQDGFALDIKYNAGPEEEENHFILELGAGEETLVARTYRLRTGSPVAFVVYEEKDDGSSGPAMVKIIEIP